MENDRNLVLIFEILKGPQPLRDDQRLMNAGTLPCAIGVGWIDGEPQHIFQPLDFSTGLLQSQCDMINSLIQG